MTRAIVVFSLESWNVVWRRNQYIIDGLLRSDPTLHVLFVAQPRDVLHDIISRRRPVIGRGLSPVGEYDGRLRFWLGTKWLPRFFGPISDALLRRSMRRGLRTSGYDDAILWFNDPDWAGLAATAANPSLYDITDDWTAANRAARHRTRIARNDDLLLESCTRVVVCSPGLLASRRGTRPDAVLVPNAVDVARYRDPVQRPADLPLGPTALYVGTLHEDRLDVDLLMETAQRLAPSGGSLVLVGPNALSADKTAQLRAEPGVVLLGARDYETIPGYLQHATVCIVPHVVDEFTDSLDPIKLYEYLAVGRPIVSTPVAGFRDVTGQPGVFVPARDAFAEVVAEICADPPPDVTREGIPDWSDRVAAFRAIIEDLDHLRAPGLD